MSSIVTVTPSSGTGICGQRSKLLDLFRDRELSWRVNASPMARWMQQEDLHDVVISKLPQCLRKELVRFPQEEKFDKIFAAQWISSDTVCFGTKDNKLVSWTYSTGAVAEVPLPDACSFPSTPVGSPATTAPSTSSPPSSSPSSPPFRSTAVGSAALLPTVGIHDIDVNFAGTSLVSGGKDDHDMALFSLPSLKPTAILKGHRDCVFASKFISDTTLLSGGRDGALFLWDISGASASCDDCDACGSSIVKEISPKQRVMRSLFRIRAIEYNDYSDTALVLSGDCSLMVFDCRTMYQVQRLSLPEMPDIVSLAVSGESSIVATGSQGGTLLQDLRTGSKIAEVCDVGLPYGVRSLAFNGDVLTIGGGGGAIDFFDLRQLKRRLPRPMMCSQGSVRGTPFFSDFVRDEVPQAVYAMKYDPNFGSRLFVAGGPLLCGLSGSYASVWA